jgi:hypothetical protein
MLTRIMLLTLVTLVTPLAHARDVLAKCYLDSRWHPESRAAWHADMVRRLADTRRTVTSAAELGNLRAILRLDRFRPRPSQPDDFCFVADIRHSNGTVESYYAGRFFVMSSNFRRGLRIDHTAFRRDVDRFMGVAR